VTIFHNLFSTCLASFLFWELAGSQSSSPVESERSFHGIPFTEHGPATSHSWWGRNFTSTNQK